MKALLFSPSTAAAPDDVQSAVNPPLINIIVTGGAGFIGSNLVRMLRRQGATVLNLDKLTYAGDTGSLTDIEGSAGYQFRRIDLCDAEAVRNAVLAFRPDAVVHLAAESHVDRSIDGPRTFVESNIVGAFNLLQASREHWQRLEGDAADRFRVVHVSTDEVFGSLGPVGKFTEQTPYNPQSPYSATKAASDHLARAWSHTYGLPVIVTNCSNNYGPNQYPEKLIPVVIVNALRGKPIPVYGNGEHVRDWMHVDDHCRALWEIVTQGVPGETYNIGAGNERRNIDLVRSICSLLDELRPRVNDGPYGRLITFVADRPGHDFRYAIDASKIRRELGWKPQVNPAAGLRSTVIWYLENEAWWEPLLRRASQTMDSDAELASRLATRRVP